MRFTPKSKSELVRLLPDGKYQAYVCGAEDKISKSSGNEMLEIKLEIYDAEGSKYFVTDRLLQLESCLFKLRAFCESANLLDRYESGELTADSVVGASVHCTIVTKQQDGYDPKNEVKNYFVPKDKTPKSNEFSGPTKSQIAEAKKNDGGDVPF